MKLQSLKKPVSVLLCLVLLLCTVSAAAAAAAPPSLTFALGTDLHLDRGDDVLPVNHPENPLYFQASGSGNLYDQADALTRDFLYGSAREGAAFVLIAGDLTRHGDETEHRAMAALLAEFEEETGVQVYLVPGNHDYFRSQPAEFKAYYADFGYNEALVVDDATASYTADVAEGYRLIAVDSNDPGVDGDGITPALLDWIDAQAKQAQADGKQILYMMHHPLLEHLYLGRLLMKDFIVRDGEAIAERFCGLGIQYVFTGHEHGNDVASYTAENGAVLYDVLTTALSSYPLEYRMVTLSPAGADLQMRRIETCDTAALLPGYTPAQIALLEQDYNAYAYGLFNYAIQEKILGYVSADFIKRKLHAQSGPLAAALDTLFAAVQEALTMPLYETADGSVSMERLAKSKGVSLPQTDYSSLIALATALVSNHYYGDEHLVSGENPEQELLMKGLNTGLQYILSKTGRSGLALLLETIGLTGFDTDQLSPLFTAVSLGREDSYQIAARVLYPLFDRFSVDAAPGDRDVFLPAVAPAADGGPATFFARILTALKRIFTYLASFFSRQISPV